MRWGRAYFAAQAVAGAVWWILVAVAPPVRVATLGSLDAGLVAALDLPLFVGASALAAFGVRRAAYLATAWTLLVTLLLALWATATSEAGWGVLAMVAAGTGSLAALALLTRGRIPTEWLVTGPFRFRPATPGRPASSHQLATAAQIVVFWGGALVAIPVVILLLEHRWQLHIDFPLGARVVGVVCLALCSALGIWSAHAVSTRGDGTPLPIATANLLVIAGPYRFVRNPMAIAGIGQGVAVGLLLSSWLVVVYALLGSLIWNHAIRPHEERDLEARFGDEFRRYRDAVRCWIPSWSRAPIAETALAHSVDGQPRTGSR